MPERGPRCRAFAYDGGLSLQTRNPPPNKSGEGAGKEDDARAAHGTHYIERLGQGTSPPRFSGKQPWH
jgi:hypothetical protein